MAIDWDRIGQKKFDRTVESLARRLYDGIADVHVIDGTGGDGGRDIVITQGSRLRIAQLKYFPEGMTGGFRHRRNQVTKSWRAIRGGGSRKGKAVRDWPHGKPDEWIFVSPSNLKPGERIFLEGLVGDTGVRLVVWDRAWLDERFAAHPDLANYLLKDDLLDERARIHHEESSNLLRGTTDLFSRVSALHQVAAEQDPDWRMDFTAVGDTQSITFAPKHSSAHLSNPITISVDAVFGDGDDELQEAFRRTVGYGGPGTLNLPDRVVRVVTVDGPPLAAGVFRGVSVTIETLGVPEAVGKPITLSFLDDEGGHVASHEGVVRHVGSGPDGVTVTADFYSGVEISMRFTRGTTDADFDSTLGSSFANVPEALRAIEFLRAVLKGGPISAATDSQPLFDGALPLAASVDDPGLDAFEETLNDLGAIERMTKRYFTVPDRISGEERARARAIRLLLEGKCVQWPGLRSVTATLNGRDGPELRELLSGELVLLRIETDMRETLFGREILTGAVNIWHPAVEIVGWEEVLAALDSGSAKDASMRMRASEGQFRVFRVGAFTGDEPVVTTPWGLHGISEPGEPGAEPESADAVTNPSVGSATPAP